MRLVGRERAIVLIDGEHHPTAVADALERLSVDRDIAAVVFCGGGEKVGADRLADAELHYGHPVVRGKDAVAALRRAVVDSEAELVIDLADEPIVDLGEKLRLASIALAAGLPYQAPGMRLDPLTLAEIGFAGPKLAVIGTGKRTGKTAICGHLATLLKQRGNTPAIVSMGRGGPVTPLVASPDTGIAELRALARRGVHAASDYLEDAVLAGVPAVGCRRVGGGPSGVTAFTNFVEGAEMAAAIDGVDGLLFEGSGSTIPPVRAERTICVTGSLTQADTLAGPLRLIEADLVLVHAGQPETAAAARRWSSGEVIEFELQPRPAERLPDDAVAAFFSTGADRIEGVEPVITSTNLARREALVDDLERAADAGCTHYLTEIKAAAIELVATQAERLGAELVFVRNHPVAEAVDIDQMLLQQFDEAVKMSEAATRVARD